MIGGRWHGLDEALAALRQIAAETTRADVAAAAMLSVARPIADEMSAAAPRRAPKPDMADSIAAARVDETENREVAAIEIGPLKSHEAGFRVRFFEFGTSKMPAWPFMRPVWDAHAERFWPLVFSAMRPAYDKAVRRFSTRARR